MLFSSYSAKTKCDGQTDGQTDRQKDRQTDGGHCYISRPGPPAPREINNHQFFIYGPQCEKCAFWAIRGGLGGP